MRAQVALAGTFPNVNRIGGMGSAKVPGLRNLELTGPYFHNGGKVTLRQVINFYAHGGDFPITNVRATRTSTSSTSTTTCRSCCSRRTSASR